MNASKCEEANLARETSASTPLVHYSIKRRGNDKGDTMNYTLGRAASCSTKTQRCILVVRDPIHAIIYGERSFVR